MGSSSPKFAIPEEFQSKLRYVDSLDKRSDEEIMASLERHVPVTSEKNIWCFWDKGLHAMPGWCLRNVISWHRLCGPSWTVRVLNAVPDSPNHILKYVSAELLPQAFVKGTMTGIYVGPHSSDFLRGATVYTHGGVYMDVGNFLFRDLDRVCWNELADPNSPFQVAIPVMYGQTTANHFVASRKGDPFIKHWHDFFVYLWKDRQSHDGLIQHPLLVFAQQFTFDESRSNKFDWDMKVEPHVIMEYISQVVSWMRLYMVEDCGDGFNGAEYWQTKVLTFDVLEECWGAEATVSFKGTELFDAFSTRLDAPKDSERYKTAYKCAWRLLTDSSLQKVTHGKNLTWTPALGAIWEEEGNNDKDHEPGTFAELLRYGAIHFEQTRDTIALLKAAPASQMLNKGLFEA